MNTMGERVCGFDTGEGLILIHFTAGLLQATTVKGRVNKAGAALYTRPSCPSLQSVANPSISAFAIRVLPS
jgi:hypothetical protein